ncbi:MAG TPA: MBL fold metallo-hydrolase [Vicinamibacterales bacterium]|nr:MBL fold metallo-hydrolase [Vicinamibacterales bacterium]
MFEPILLTAGNPGPMTGAGNNTYLLVGPGERAVLVDAGVGAPQHLSDLDLALESNGVTLEKVVVTHGHVDHASGAPAIAATHPTVRFAKHPWPEEDARYGVNWEPLSEGDLVDIGDEQLTVLETPGHSPDHVALWHEATRAAFTGDLVILGGSVMIHSSRGGDLGAYLSSLERLRAMEPRVLFPAHGARIDEPHHVLAQFIEHRMMRERQVLDALSKGHSSVNAIADSIYDRLAPALMPAACENVQAHLLKLEKEGLASRDAGQWRVS